MGVAGLAESYRTSSFWQWILKRKYKNTEALCAIAECRVSKIVFLSFSDDKHRGWIEGGSSQLSFIMGYLQFNVKGGLKGQKKTHPSVYFKVCTCWKIFRGL